MRIRIQNCLLGHGIFSPLEEAKKFPGKILLIDPQGQEDNYCDLVDFDYLEDVEEKYDLEYLTGIEEGTPFLTFRYKNHRGEVSERKVFPIATYFGSTDFYKDAWLLLAWDFGKEAVREFSILEMLNN